MPREFLLPKRVINRQPDNAPPLRKSLALLFTMFVCCGLLPIALAGGGLVALHFIEDQRLLLFILTFLLIGGLISAIAMSRRRHKHSYTVDPQVDDCCNQ